MAGTEFDKGVLYGVAIVRAQGPDEYVHAFPEFVTEKEIILMQSPAADSGIPVIAPIVLPLTPPVPTPSLPQRPVGSFGIGMGPMGGLPGPGQGALGGMGSSPRAGALGPLGTMNPVSFNMGGVQQNVLPGVVRTLPVAAATSGLSTSSAVPALVPVPVPVQVPVLGPAAAATKETIKKVAQFCASNGASTINMLKNKPGAANVMPFLFEGQPGYEDFLSTLKSILGMASSNSSTNNANNNTKSSTALTPLTAPSNNSNI